MLSIFYAVKGGDGATTVAAAAGLLSAPHMSTMLIDLAPFDDLANHLGQPRPAAGVSCHVADGLTLERYTDIPSDAQLGAWAAAPNVHFVVDLGTLSDPRESRVEVARFGHAATLVIRPTFASLQHHQTIGVSPSRVLMLDGFPGQALTAREVTDVIGRRVDRLGFDPSVVRRADSGTLAGSIPPNLRVAVEALVPQAVPV